MTGSTKRIKPRKKVEKHRYVIAGSVNDGRKQTNDHYIRMRLGSTFSCMYLGIYEQPLYPCMLKTHLVMRRDAMDQ